MFDPQMALLSKVLEGAAAALAANPDDASAWATAEQAFAATGSGDPEIAALLAARDRVALSALVAGWNSGQHLLPVCDREVLKRAMSAFRKSLKVTRLNDESSLTRNPMTQGRHSGIQGMTPPSRYPPEVWRELARQGRLIAAKQGIYELPPE
jgi:hypothetical protein